MPLSKKALKKLEKEKEKQARKAEAEAARVCTYNECGVRQKHELWW